MTSEQVFVSRPTLRTPPHFLVCSSLFPGVWLVQQRSLQDARTRKSLLSLRLHRWNKAPSSLLPSKLQAGSGLSCLPPTSKLLIPSRSCQVSWHGSPAFKAHFHSPLRLAESLQYLHPPLTWGIYHLLFSSELFTCSLSLLCDKHFSWSVICLSCHVSCCYFSMNSVIPRESQTFQITGSCSLEILQNKYGAYVQKKPQLKTSCAVG